MFYKVYGSITTEEYGDRNPLNLGITVSELEKKLPKVEMNGAKGLYVSVMAYNHATGNNINYEDIKELMDQGKVIEVYETYTDYLDWFKRPDTSGRYVTGYGITYRDDYNSAVIQTAGKYSIIINGHSSYEDYKKIIETYPDDVEYFFNSGNKNGK